MWEDEANKAGGRWILKLNKGYVNRFWEELVRSFIKLFKILALIGEQFEAENEINGIVISTRYKPFLIF
jgi:translation initiation factor 4E